MPINKSQHAILTDFIQFVFVSDNDPSSATRPTRAFDCNLDAMAGLAAAHG